MEESAGIVAFTKALLSEMEMQYDKSESTMTTEQASHVETKMYF